MDRNTFTGLFLILIILIGFTYLTKPSEEEIKRERIVQDSIARSKTTKDTAAIAANASPVKKDTTPTVDSAVLGGPFGPANQGTASTVVLQNEHLKVNLSTKGGRIASVELKEYKTYDKKPVILFNEEESNFGLVFNAGNAVISTKNLYFIPSASQLTVSSKDSGAVTMRLNYSPEQYIDYIYSLKGGSYKVDLTIVTKGLQKVISPTQPLSLNWEATLRQKEKDLNSEHRYSGAYFNHAENEVDHIGTTKDEKKDLGEDGKIKWISFKQHFFSNVLIARNGFDKGTLSVTTSSAPGIVKSFAASMQLAAPKQDVNTYPLEFYFGPNRFTTLKSQGYDLERQIDLGWGPLKWINRVAVIPLFNGLEALGWGYGLIILVLTIILKLVLTPLTYKSYLSMAKMRVLKPEMDEIKAKVGEDNATLLQQEYLKLYKKAGVNPLGGCIPMVLQLPIVMAFFFFFPNLFELRQESFLWMKDLSTYDSVINFAKIPLINVDHISLMCLLMTLSTLVITYFNNQTSGATGQMKYIGYITPVIFLGVLNSYPAGLNYYYFLANLLTFVQQMIIRQWVNDDKIHARIQENKKKPTTEKKKSKFQQRMDDYMRQQQAKAKEQPKKK
ncbi:YidC/Oxa1 family membrane protein insertase [Arcticibacter tournemirensis]|uniref:Membrane protein insertase YidC n=1 Tax=Arcticibacter tournemirensis TaxID=699437 RepID=A0A4Q0MFM4_9SPHI|nr:membrane protein insertase YidC [Arcticibacter tournemirensis]KAA8477154.1 membrane protein insertase YidC [Arcticibacter tournemirensis]RXF72321.1 membrane protein insertase YidC [Arcticibacter tournemirensis]TQM51200.1 YidC/Oxa1 family membrane protein insertase [Arcticibacter tournemirensis]